MFERSDSFIRLRNDGKLKFAGQALHILWDIVVYIKDTFAFINGFDYE